MGPAIERGLPTFEQFKEIWISRASFSYVAICDDLIAGAYFVKPQWPGRGSRVAAATVGAYLFDAPAPLSAAAKSC